MPSKPKRPCAYPGCPRLTNGYYCEEHQRLVNHQYEKYKRNPETHKRYNAAWQVIRKQYAAEHPLCELCLEGGRLTPAEHIHHKKPLAEGGSNNFDNLMALCKSCHSRVHALHGDRWGQRGTRDKKHTDESKTV